MNDNTKAAPQGVASEMPRPDIQAILIELDVPVVAYLGGHSGKLVKDQTKLDAFETEVPLVMQRDHRAACQKIAALAQTEQAAPRMGAAVTDAGSEPDARFVANVKDMYNQATNWPDSDWLDEFCREVWLAALAASATPGSGEPVARAFVDGNDVCRELRWMPDLPSFDLPVGTKLYAHPPAASAGDALTDAKRFHDTYERLAPQFGYVTRPQTRAFDPESPNGKLMIAVCAALKLSASGADGGKRE